MVQIWTYLKSDNLKSTRFDTYIIFVIISIFIYSVYVDRVKCFTYYAINVLSENIFSICIPLFLATYIFKKILHKYHRSNSNKFWVGILLQFLLLTEYRVHMILLALVRLFSCSFGWLQISIKTAKMQNKADSLNKLIESNMLMVHLYVKQIWRITFFNSWKTWTTRPSAHEFKVDLAMSSILGMRGLMVSSEREAWTNFLIWEWYVPCWKKIAFVPINLSLLLG